MTNLSTSLRFADLPAVAELIAGFGGTGRLRIKQGAWSGEMLVRRGQIVRASLNAECGRAALDGMAIGLLDGELSFAFETVAEDDEPLLDPAERARVLKRLSRERQQVANLIPSLQLVPRLVETTDSRPTDGTVTLVAVGAAALEIIPSLAFGRTLEELARERGLARTVRDIATLVAGNAVKLEAPPTGHRPAGWPRQRRAPSHDARGTRPAPDGATQIGATPSTGHPTGRLMPPPLRTSSKISSVMRSGTVDARPS